MRSIKAAVPLAVLVALVMCIVPAFDSDGARMDGNAYGHFDTMSGGTLNIPLFNDAGAFDATFVVTENGKDVYSGTHTVASGESVVSLDMEGFKGEGGHSVKVTMTPAEGSGGHFEIDSFNYTIVVEKNILSDWTTYLVIAIAVIAIVVVVYLKMRDTPKEKNTMTFEQLEAERKAEMAARSEKKGAQKTEKVSTERKRYSGRKKD